MKLSDIMINILRRNPIPGLRKLTKKRVVREHNGVFMLRATL